MVDATIQWWTQYELAFASSDTIRCALANSSFSDRLTIWAADTVYLLLRRRIDAHADGRINARPWTILAIGDTPHVVAECGDSDWARSTSLHPLHAYHVARARHRAALYTERQRLEQQREQLQRDCRRLEQPVTRTHTAPDLEAALRVQRLWSAALRGDLSSHQLEQVRAGLRTTYHHALDQVQARLDTIRAELDQRDRPMAPMPMGSRETLDYSIHHEEVALHPQAPDETRLTAAHHELAAQLTQVTVPVPPGEILEQALQYPGVARFVAFYLARKGRFDDGVFDAEVITDALLQLIYHAAVGPHLCGYAFGGDDSPARHALILDRHERTLFVAPIDIAMAFVRTQDRSALVQASYVATGPYGKAFLALDQDAQNKIITERIQAWQQACHALGAWLDVQPVTIPDTSNPSDWTVASAYGMLSISFRGTPIGFGLPSGEALQLWGGYTVFEEAATAALQRYRDQQSTTPAPEADGEA